MLIRLRQKIIETTQKSLKSFFDGQTMPLVEVEVPADKTHGDFSTNIALKSTKLLKRPPLEVAATFCDAIRAGFQKAGMNDKIAKIEVLKPGFINFYLSPVSLCDILEQTLRDKENYGKSDFGKSRKINIEFVSANPTGPLSVAHARQAAVGDALANIFNFIGFSATKEYYVNDEGNQINILGNSVYLRALERLGQKEEFPEDCYQGQYIYEMADVYLAGKKIKTVQQLQALSQEDIRQFAVGYLMTVIKDELKDFGVTFDVWSHQSKIAGEDQIKKTLSELQSKRHIYEKEGALWFNTTQYGDDKDRVVRKSDGSYTYFMPDIVYHQDKFRRGFEKVFNLWGPDHHGYIQRLSAAIQSLGQPKEALHVLIVQLATLYRDGQEIQMSTRRGQYITLREVIEEVGVDAARFFFLMRLVEAHLDFDLALAKKETPENPVYYIQYAHARTYSVEAKAKEVNLSAKATGFKNLQEAEEVDLIKKIGHFPMILLFCWRQADVFALVNYLQELAAVFHRFYDRQRVVDVEKPELSAERLALINASRIVIANGLRLLGVSSPQKM
ncbi:MAG: arginine--tRNA ligase [Candidatus Omnitrophica bacterium]|nr:arginine--tRNA ligase [Candidatus Omnitrophota bacterium]